MGDTTITVASSTGFAVGNVIPIYNGTTTTYKVITVIAGNVLTLDSAIGVAYSNTNTSVGNADMVGVIWTYIDDATDWFLHTKNVASTRVMPPIQIPAKATSSTVAVQEEGAVAGTRATLNFAGASVTAVDNAGANRVDVTVTGKYADGTAAAPNIGFLSDPDTGLYLVAGNDIALTAGGWPALRVIGVTAGASGNYVEVQNVVLGGTPRIAANGPDVNINLNLVTKGTGVLQVNGVAILTNLNAKLAADVTMTAAATWYDGATVTLSAGTWLITAHITVNDLETASVTSRLWDGTSAFASGASTDQLERVMSLSSIYVATGTPTVRIAAASTLASGVIKAATTQYAQGNNATQITAVRLGA